MMIAPVPELRHSPRWPSGQRANDKRPERAGPAGPEVEEVSAMLFGGLLHRYVRVVTA
ncbi:MAG: hypothetical protein O7H41_08015 [Planctomycetota bacterium]|nr:hypothetical protein [Planctomycetota bacterium]